MLPIYHLAGYSGQIRQNYPTFAGLPGFVLLLLVIVLLAACQPHSSQVFIEVDGNRKTLTTEATSVRAALAEAKVNLGSLDRVSPDLYAELQPGMLIRVTRVNEEIITSREVVPYERQTVVNEALAAGDTRLAQAGVNGEDEVTTRVVYEDGLEASRTEVSRRTVIEPVPEILAVGPRSQLPSVPVEGTIAYLSNGNAWLMRDSSNSRRLLTSSGDLDGRVFSLSPDGRYLLYTRHITDNLDLPLNELELVSTTIVGEPPLSLPPAGILNAAWSPVISPSLLAYSTAERTASPPGWRANNDLWLLQLENGQPVGRPVELIKPNTAGLYGWWGATFTWSPGGRQLAYARPDQIGLVTLAAEPWQASTTPLLDFIPLKTFSEWVWVPGISWSPDEKFIAAVVHGEPVAAEPAEESPIFDLWLLSTGGDISLKVVDQVGMWANPVWGEAGIAFGQAFDALESANSRYSIQAMDRDGSNRRLLFPFREELGVEFPEMAWLPDGQTLVFIYNGNLYTVAGNGSPPRQLTADSQASRISWAAEAPPITATLTPTVSPSPGPTQEVSSTGTPTPGPINAEPTEVNRD